MVKIIYEIVWTKPSQKQLLAAFEYINQDSPVNAKKVIYDIITAADKAITNPEYYDQISTK
jgi:plasmid stabilization system protein ParE